MIEGLNKLLAKGMDSPELRFGLGKGYLEQGDSGQAIVHLSACVAQKADYSAGWKLLGKAYLQQGDRARAASAWRTGIDVAERRGDKQASKEMAIFLKRLQKAAAPADAASNEVGGAEAGFTDADPTEG